MRKDLLRGLGLLLLSFPLCACAASGTDSLWPPPLPAQNRGTEELPQPTSDWAEPLAAPESPPPPEEPPFRTNDSPAVTETSPERAETESTAGGIEKSSETEPNSPSETASPTPIALTPEFRRQILYRLPIDSPEVVLTFDDGPSKYLDPILEILEKEEIPAVFFFIGSIPGTSDAARRVVEAGHQVGAHSMTHKQMTKLSTAEKRTELAESQAVVAQLLEFPVLYFRTPYGSTDDEVVRLAAELGMQVVLWNVDSRDWALAHDPDQILRNVMSTVKPGSIILLHERRQTVEILPQLIAELRAAGYQFRSLP